MHSSVPLPRLLIYSAPFSPKVGGMERFAEDLAGGLQAAGFFEITVATTTPGGRGDSRFAFRVVRVAKRRELARHFREADVILFVGLTFWEVALAATLGRPFLLTHHGEYVSYGNNNPLARGIMKRQLCRLFPNVSVSKYVAGRLPGRHTVVHNSFRSDVFRRARNGIRSTSYAFVGRLVSDKGCGLLLEAFARLQALRPGATLTVIGDGPDRRHLENRAKTLGCSIEFTGALPPTKIAEILQATECLVVPSVWPEPFGITALEGLACGCQVVVSNRGGLPEVVDRFGWRVEPSIDAIFEAMLKIASGSRVPVDGVEEFLASHTQEAMAVRYHQVLQTLMPRSRLTSRGGVRS